MAALSDYPKNGTVVRGDPLVIPVDISTNGVPQDASGSDWRAQVRTNFDAALVVEFACTVVTPAGGSVPSRVLMAMDGTDTELLKSGMVFDLEELDQTTGATIRTWWICTNLKIQPDVSRDDPGPVVQLQSLLKANARA